MVGWCALASETCFPRLNNASLGVGVHWAPQDVPWQQESTRFHLWSSWGKDLMCVCAISLGWILLLGLCSVFGTLSESTSHLGGFLLREVWHEVVDEESCGVGRIACPEEEREDVGNRLGVESTDA